MWTSRFGRRSLANATVPLVTIALGLSACALPPEGGPTASLGSTTGAIGATTGQVRQTNRTGSSSGASVAGWFSEAPVAGNLVCVTVVANTSLTVTGVSGGGVSAWHLAVSASPPDGTMATYYGIVGATPSDGVTATFSGGISYAEIYMVEISGVAALDVAKTASGTGTTASVPSMSLAGGGEVVVSQSWLQGGAVTSVSDNGFVDSFSPVGNGPGIFESYDVLGSATSYSAETYKQPSGSWYSQAVAFAPAPSVAVRQTDRSSSSSSSAVSASFSSAPKTGSLVAATVFSNDSLSISGLTGGGVSSWHLGENSNPPGGTMATYWGVVGSSPAETVTASLSGRAAYAEMYIVEVTGATTADVSKTASGKGTLVDVPALSLAGSDEVVLTQTWLQGGAVSSVADHGFTDAFSVVGNGPGIFESYDVTVTASSYTPEAYTQPNGLYYTQAIAFKSGGAPPSHDAGSGPVDAAAPKDSATKDSEAKDSETKDSGTKGTGTKDSGTTSTSSMPAPTGWSYSQLVWDTDFGYAGMGSSPSAPNEGTFVAGGEPAPSHSVGLLNDWNFGVQQAPGSVWSVSGSSPYWGSSEAAQTGSYASSFAADYSFPGNVFQTSTGANSSLFGGYAPQTFTSSGTGLSLFDHYVGGPLSLPIHSNGSIYYYMWSSGTLNTEGKRFFPFGAATEFYAQVSAKVAGPNNGSWSAIRLLPDQGEGGTGQEIDIQEYNVNGPNEYDMDSHVQAPVVAVGTGVSKTPLCDGYHVYGWHINSATHTLTTYLDGAQTGTYTGAQVGSHYFLILNAAVSSGQASWEQSEGFVSNSNADMDFSVGEVQVYQP